MYKRQILYQVADGVATITLNRPAKLNAFNDEMIGETLDALRAAGRDDAARCIVLTGAGQRGRWRRTRAWPRASTPIAAR